VILYRPIEACESEVTPEGDRQAEVEAAIILAEFQMREFM